MWVAERTPAQQPPFAQHAGERVDHAHLQRLGRRKPGQESGEARGEHRLAGAGRADHEQMMPAGRRDFERALGALLALDVAQIGIDRFGRFEFRHGRSQHLRALEVIDQRDQALRRQHMQPFDPGGLASLRRGTDQRPPARMRADRRRQHAGDGRDPPIQPQLADHGIAGELLDRQRAHGGEQRDRDRQVEMAAFLLHIGRGEVHRDA